jgi:hypothetical protein
MGMDNIVNLQKYRTRAIEHKGFDPWHKRFGESYDQHTRLPDLSEKTLYQLALPGEDTAIAYYELIMGILDFGQSTKFYYLDTPGQMKVIDIHLFLSDQVRFEMMRRLGWINSYACENHSLLKMVMEFDEVKAMAGKHPPALSASYPDYEAYKELTAGDKEVFIRQRLRDALDTFQKMMGT